MAISLRYVNVGNGFCMTVASSTKREFVVI